MVFNENRVIMAIGDSKELLEGISHTFELNQFEVVEAMDYQQANYCLEDEELKLVIIDLSENEEEMHNILLNIRGDERFIDIPVFLIGTDLSTERRDELLELGISATFNKPYSLNELYLRAEQLLELIEVRDELDKKNLTIASIYDEIKEAKFKMKSLNDENQNLKSIIDTITIQDRLTGLFNRSYALDQLEMALSRYNRSEITSSVILCNIDDFTEVNNSYGNHVGDDVLKEVAKALSKNKRNQDVFSRYDGDTFMIVLPDTDMEGAKFFAERARKLVESGKFTEKELAITITFGVVTYNQVMSLDMTMKMVEDALRFGKQSGKNKVLIANELLNR